MTVPLELDEQDGAWYLSSVELQRAVGGDRTVNLPRYRRCIAAATSDIDRWTGRRFLRDVVASTRSFRTGSPWRVCVGDYEDPASVVVETDDAGDGTWSAWDAAQWRPAADDRGLGRDARMDGEPWRWVVSTGTRGFPVSEHLYRVRVTTRWNWAVTPQPVIEACLHLATAYFNPRDRAEQIMAADPVETAKCLVRPYAVEGGELFYQPLVG